MRVWADRETGTVRLSVGPDPDQIVMSLSVTGASHLLDAVRRELNTLDPDAYDCDDCLDTGERWHPIGYRAVAVSRCHCPAARR